MREVLLKIKSASHRCEDLEIPCNLSVTVKELKKLIQIHYSLHPDIGDQRLIYAGHLLEDSQTLAQILLPNSEAAQTSFTLHLACTSSFFQPQRQQTPRPQETPKDAPTVTASSPSPPQQAPLMQGVPPELLGLHQLYVQQMTMYMNQWSQGNAQYNSFNVNWNPNPVQTNQNQFPTMTDPVRTASASASDASGASFGVNPSEAEAAAEAARIAEEAARAAAEAARAANAARVAAARDDEDAPRDVIDWMYTFSRVALIFSVVYFYSNFTRFFLVVVLSALVFILQRRPLLWNGRQPAAPEVVPNAAGAAENQNRGREQGAEVEREPELQPPGVNAAVGEEIRGSEEASADDNPVELIPEPQENARINPRDVTWTFLTTFFTSLIPEIPQN